MREQTAVLASVFIRIVYGMLLIVLGLLESDVGLAIGVVDFVVRPSRNEFSSIFGINIAWNSSVIREQFAASNKNIRTKNGSICSEFVVEEPILQFRD